MFVKVLLSIRLSAGFSGVSCQVVILSFRRTELLVKASKTCSVCSVCCVGSVFLCSMLLCLFVCLLLISIRVSPGGVFCAVLSLFYWGGVTSSYMSTFICVKVYSCIVGVCSS